MEYIIYYFAIALTFLFVDAIIAGMNGTTWNSSSIKDALLWPLTTGVLFGLLLRILIEKRKGNK